MKVICFDIGGTQIRAALAADNGLIEVKRAPTRADGDPARLLSQIKEMYQALGADADVFALGCPGPVQGGKMLGSPPLRIAGDIDFQSEIKSFFKNPVFVANDLNMATRAQKKACNLSNFCLLTISTGIGVGAVSNGEVLNHRIEIGHSLVESEPSKANSCMGHNGCWVAQASGSGIEKRLGKAQLPYTSLSDFFSQPDPRILKEIQTYNARGIANLIHAFDPEKIFVMGSVATYQFHNIMPSAEMLSRCCLLRPLPDIELSQLGDDIGLLGALELAKEMLWSK